MARTPKNLVIGQLATTGLTTIYTAPTGINTAISTLGFTNTTTSVHSMDIYHGTGTDFLKKTMTIPGGSGIERIYFGFQSRVINAGHTIKIQSDSASAINYDVNGSEVEVS